MAMQNLTVCDQQHSVLASAGGAARSYSPYGALSAAIGPRLAYCGQAREASTGFYQLGNGYRIYDPCLMRFLSPDVLSPFANGGINAYAYCAGDPINYQDRNGRARGSVTRRGSYKPVSGGFVPGRDSARAITHSTGSVEYSSTLASTITTEASDGVVEGPGWSPLVPISAGAAVVHIGVAIGLAKTDLKKNARAVGLNLAAGVINGVATPVHYAVGMAEFGGGWQAAQLIGLMATQVVSSVAAGAVTIAKPSARGRQPTEPFETQPMYRTPPVENEPNLSARVENDRLDTV